MRVLLVEDDANLTRSLAHILEANSYDVDSVTDGTTGLAYAEQGPYDVIILDGMLPKMDGLDIARNLRRQGVSTPIIMLTARSTTADKITGLDAGADDYLTKPFSPSELLARLRALLRRRGDVVFETLRAGDLTLDLDAHELSCNDESIHLRTKEFLMARVLLSNAGHVVAKDTLIDRVWGIDSETSSNSVEAHISFLRKKLRFLHSNCSIVTVTKVGYRLETGASQ